ncbi:MAG TPA: response regulator [Pirellulales bacterium]|jgi:DNA-binding response OmpR family regulator|nr:response regulator [Pirellulales bacterium]
MLAATHDSKLRKSLTSLLAVRKPVEEEPPLYIAEAEPTAHRTVLIAEDDYELASVLTKRFRELDLDVFRSPDAMHALLGAHRIRPNLLLLDVHLSSGNGLCVCEFLASDKSGLADIPVIIMSGQCDDETVRRCRSLGARFVKKSPQLWQQVQPLLRELLDGEAPQTAKTDGGDVGMTESSENAATTPEVVTVPVVPNGSANAKKTPLVLCIDDDPDISRIITLRLARYNVEVRRAFKGMQGYWASLDIRPDVIISDMVMPDGEGTYLFARLQAHSLTKGIPFIVLTGQASPALKRQMLSLGASAYLKKPMVFEELLEHLRKHIPLEEPSGDTSS